MRKTALIPVFLSILLLASCGERKDDGPSLGPALRLVAGDVGAFNASVRVQYSLCREIVLSVTDFTGAKVFSETSGGLTPEAAGNTLGFLITGLRPNHTYSVTATGYSDGREGSASLEITTTRGPSGLYGWEQRRSSAPSFPDITIITRGQHNPNPPLWTKERFLSHVLFRDSDGKSFWFFDAFLCLDGYDGLTGRALSVSPNAHAADRAGWERLAEFFLGEGGALELLDDAVDDAAAAVGSAPPAPRYIVMAMPDPIMLEYFADKNSSTTYWGAFDDGTVPDFSRASDQVRAASWYIDLCRSLFNERGYRNLELAGFYIISEELHLAPSFYSGTGLGYSAADTWNHENKHWETVIPEIASYLHGCNEGLYWIPYFLAPGHRVWRQLGLDMAWMQPNHYWDTANQHPMATAVTAMKNYRLSMELEFEYSMVEAVMKDGRTGPDGSGNPTFTYADIPALRDRFREYMTAFKDAGWYGVRPIALYSGTDALNQLATSSEAGDREIYNELGHFITDSPLKK